MSDTFEIKAKHPDSGELLNATVRHQTETFDLDVQGQQVSLINNGDNSWSIVRGSISQEMANVLGQAIEDRLKNEL